jgi:hypothetical protein
MDAKQKLIKDFELKIQRISADIAMMNRKGKYSYEQLESLMALLDKAGNKLSDAMNIAACEE